MLRPVESDVFLATQWGERFVHIPGPPGKFAGLLPWSVLNTILEQHRLEPPRLRLTRNGKSVAPDAFLSFQQNRRTASRAIPRLDAAALTRELRNGSTLVLDAVDELYRPVTRLTESLETMFRVRVQVNAYAGWRTSHGFDLHWDDHDVFILQVAGRKHWKIYGTTRLYPLARDIDPAPQPPDNVLWQGLLEDGDLLYIPRGWWHVATPLDEPTLHLTVGVNNPTGADFLAWFVDRLRASEIVRRDIPHLKSRETRAVYGEGLRAALTAEWNEGIIDEFLADLDARSRPRPHLALPWSATESILPPDEARVKWNGARLLPVHRSDSEVTIDANGRRWRFAADAHPLLELLVSGREISLDELCRAGGAALGPDVIRAFIRELVGEGLVVCYGQF